MLAQIGTAKIALLLGWVNPSPQLYSSGFKKQKIPRKPRVIAQQWVQQALAGVRSEVGVGEGRNNIILLRVLIPAWDTARSYYRTTIEDNWVKDAQNFSVYSFFHSWISMYFKI